MSLQLPFFLSCQQPSRPWASTDCCLGQDRTSSLILLELLRPKPTCSIEDMRQPKQVVENRNSMLSGDKPARDLHEYLFSSSDGRCIFVGKMLNELSAGEKMTWVEKQDLSPEGFIRIFQPETGRSPLPHHYPNKLSYKQAISPISRL